MARTAAGGTSHVHAVLLAAGRSKRFGKDNKLLAEIGGIPLVRRVAEILLASNVAEVVVVVGFEARKVSEALSGLELQRAFNADHEEGLSSSLRSGVDSLPAEARGAMIVLADMPGVTVKLVNRLIDTFERADCDKIVFPTHGDGEQGNPVIWPRRFFPELLALEGDKGAKSLIKAHPQDCVGVAVKNESAFGDIDAPADLAPWRK